MSRRRWSSLAITVVFLLLSAACALALHRLIDYGPALDNPPIPAIPLYSYDWSG